MKQDKLTCPVYVIATADSPIVIEQDGMCCGMVYRSSELAELFMEQMQETPAETWKVARIAVLEDADDVAGYITQLDAMGAKYAFLDSVPSGQSHMIVEVATAFEV